MNEKHLQYHCANCIHRNVCTHIETYQAITGILGGAVKTSCPEWLAYRIVCREFTAENGEQPSKDDLIFWSMDGCHSWEQKIQ